MEPQSSWPGARSPTRHDVPQASELPDTSFLSEFKARLLAHQDAKIHQRRVPVHLLQDRFDLDDVRPFTYPLTVLSGFPTLPSNEELGQLRAAFVVTFQKHAFVEPIINRERLSDPVPPYLDVAVACLGSVLTPASMRGGMIGDDLFLAGFQLTTFMAEVDNRHSRLLELPAALAMLSTYGMLTSNRELWTRADSMFTYGLTMARRQAIFDLRAYSRDSLDRSKDKSRTLACYMLLADTVRSIQCGTETQLSPGELSVSLSSDPNLRFSDVYAHMFTSRFGLPPSVSGDEDGLLLLTAVLSDYLLVRRLMSTISTRKPSTIADLERIPASCSNLYPFMHLTPGMEDVRMQSQLSNAISHWYEHFVKNTDTPLSHDVVALYWYARLLFECPDLLELSKLAQDEKRPEDRTTFAISDEAVQFAWYVLDYVTAPNADNCCGGTAIWTPPITFHAALVVWQKLRADTEVNSGALRALDPFKEALAAMPWPCCEVMVATLDALR